jgi:pimeloyl-ACP methyl ester carboxylesterase
MRTLLRLPGGGALTKKLSRPAERALKASVFFAAEQVLRAAGFKFELRRRGELRLGVWRKKLRPAARSADKRRLVLIPGFGDSAVSWWVPLATLLPMLSREWDEVCLLEFPGFEGRLRHHRPCHSMDLLVDFVTDVLDGLKPTAIFGHSLGGWLAAMYGLDCAQNPRKKYAGPRELFLACPSGVLGDEDEKKRWKKTFDLARDGDFDAFKKTIFHKEPVWFRLFSHTISDFFDQEEIVQFMDSIGEKHFLEERAALLQAHVTLIWGDRDTLNPTRWMKLWRAHLETAAHAQVKTVTLKRAGHNFHLENPIRAALLMRKLFLTAKA